MSVNRKHGQVKRLILCGQFCQFVLCELKQTLILESPPDTIPFRNQTVFCRIVIVKNIIIPMAFIKQLSSSEFCIGTNHQRLAVTGALENIPDGDNVREERILGIHGILFNRNIQRQPRTLRKHRSDRPCCARHCIASVQRLVVARKAFILFGQFRKLRNDIRIKRSAAGRVAVSHLH